MSMLRCERLLQFVSMNCGLGAPGVTLLGSTGRGGVWNRMEVGHQVELYDFWSWQVQIMRGSGVGEGRG